MPTNRNTMPATFADLATALGGRTSRKVCNNTTAERLYNGAMAVALHGHRLAEFYDNGSVWVSDAGYVTTTTYDRLKRIVAPLGATVYRRKGQGYIRTRDGVTLPLTGGLVRFRPDGTAFLA